MNCYQKRTNNSFFCHLLICLVYSYNMLRDILLTQFIYVFCLVANVFFKFLLYIILTLYVFSKIILHCKKYNFIYLLIHLLVEETKNTIKRRSKRAVSGRKTIELMMAADYKMVEHYSKLFLPTYMLAVANIVSFKFYLFSFLQQGVL